MNTKAVATGATACGLRFKGEQKENGGRLAAVFTLSVYKRKVLASYSGASALTLCSPSPLLAAQVPATDDTATPGIDREKSDFLLEVPRVEGQCGCA